MQIFRTLFIMAAVTLLGIILWEDLSPHGDDRFWLIPVLFFGAVVLVTIIGPTKVILFQLFQNYNKE